MTRQEFFARIRGEMRKTSGLFAASVTERPAHPQRIAETLRRELSERWPETLKVFRREFERVGGIFYRVPSLTEVPEIVGTLARERGARRVITWHPSALRADLSAPLMAQDLEARLMPPGGLPEAERNRLRAHVAEADLGLTGVDLAVAETGTLVLVSGAGRPRSTSLLPPYHVAVFDRTALVESLQQVGVFLESWHEGQPPGWRGGAIHFITGPSRTADIELTLTRGVHGPKEVHAIFVDAPLVG
ncbi:MAG TPA: lactate utilization protein [Methylomirabilota bacterium]|jgi:L-lactate dehydrogenase complex protein LldG|nr:lactate utilization protein [Methylomirabilota bacterium]